MSRIDKSKIPLRGIGKLFTHLDPGIRAKLESAFVEAETQINYHNNSLINNQERRVLSSNVSAPIIELTQNSRGFDVTWPRLNDRNILKYEAQVSLTSNFSDPTSYELAETSLTVEGVGATVYVRVRGVRWDGTTGNWSNIVSTSFSASGPIVYSRGLDDVEPFYVINPGYPYPKPIQRLRITPQRQNGGMVIFGSFNTKEVVAAGDPTLIVTLNGVTVSTVTQSEYDVVDGPAEGKGCAFGPVFVRHDEFYFADAIASDATTRGTSGDSSGAGVHTNWTAADPTVYNVVFGISSGAQNATTTYVNFTGFNFGIPTGNTISGIQVLYEVTDNNFDSGVYDNANLTELRLLDSGTARADKVASPDWGNNVTSSFGGSADLWGEAVGFWTPAKVNSSTFGVRIRGRVFAPSTGGSRSISATWPTIIIYSTNETTGEIDVQIRFWGTPSGGDLLACTLNVIEFGESL